MSYPRESSHLIAVPWFNIIDWVYFDYFDTDHLDSNDLEDPFGRIAFQIHHTTVVCVLSFLM